MRVVLRWLVVIAVNLAMTNNTCFAEVRREFQTQDQTQVKPSLLKQALTLLGKNKTISPTSMQFNSFLPKTLRYQPEEKKSLLKRVEGLVERIHFPHPIVNKP